MSHTIGVFTESSHTMDRVNQLCLPQNEMDIINKTISTQKEYLEGSVDKRRLYVYRSLAVNVLTSRLDVKGKKL